MPPTCLNCDAPAPGNFCAQCGQRVESSSQPLRALLGEFLAEFSSLDGRLGRTIAQLWNPGRLTQLYLAGQRTSYASPFRIYLVASLLFFFLVNFAPPNAEKFNVYVGNQLIGREEPVPGLNNLQLLSIKETGRITRWVASRIQSNQKALQARSAQDLLDGLFHGLERTVPTALICFVPFLGLALKLLYWRRKILYVDHLVLAVHFQSFLFAAMVAARMVNLAGLAKLIPSPLTYLAAFFLAAPIFTLIALRRIYRQSWLKTTVKSGVLGLLYLMLLQLTLGLTMFFVLRSI